MSVFGCGTAIVSSPALVYVATQSALPKVASSIAIGAVLITGVGSTAFLTWFLRPYVTRMRVKGYDSYADFMRVDREKRGEVPLELSRFDMFGREVATAVKARDLELAQTWRPMVMWQRRASGNDNKPSEDFFFIHPEVVGETAAGRDFIRYLDESKVQPASSNVEPKSAHG